MGGGACARVRRESRRRLHRGPNPPLLAAAATAKDALQITYGRFNHYLLNADIPFTFLPVYTIHVICAHGGSHDASGPAQLLWLSTIGYKPISPAHGWTSLADTTTAPDGTVTWKWDLTPH